MEAAVMGAARGAGLPVPEVLAILDGTGVVPGLVMECVDGESIPRRVLRDGSLARARAGLARQCGEALGRLHRAEPPAGLTPVDRLAEYRQILDRLGAHRPVLELGHRWLAEHRPPLAPPVLVHGDFRLGNLIVGDDGLLAVLDWESAHLGDPLEDLGWLCVPAWRFRGPQPVGGFGSIDDLLDGYRTVTGRTVNMADLTWAITLGTWVWAVGCLQQAERHRSGSKRSVDLAAVGRRVVENEADLLRLLAPMLAGAPLSIEAAPIAPGDPGDGRLPFGPPSLEELLDAVRAFLEDDVLASAELSTRYQLQVCVSILRMAGREVASRRREEAVDDAALANEIRAGVGPEPASLVPLLAARTAARLAVTNPRYGDRQ
jgi:aminoglycoside phosphotransferase (APT) family kinase protein